MNQSASNTLRKKIVFIFNPFSGVKQKDLIEKEVHTYIDKSQYEYEIRYTEYPNHAIEIAKECVENKVDIVVAVGGDGSVNEVGQSLIGTKTVLGILPAGSGNGFAMHLGLGRKAKKAIHILNTGTPRLVDTCTINGRPFINLSGMGFDAKVAYFYKRVKKRGFWGYFKSSIQQIRHFKFQQYQVKVDGVEVLNRECFSIVVANAPMYGYNFVIAPKALLDDGQLEIVAFYKAKIWRYFFSLWRMLNQSMHKTSLADRFSGKKVEVSFLENQAYAHVDGEGFIVKETQVFEIIPQSLLVIVPQ